MTKKITVKVDNFMGESQELKEQACSKEKSKILIISPMGSGKTTTLKKWNKDITETLISVEPLKNIAEQQRQTNPDEVEIHNGDNKHLVIDFTKVQIVTPDYLPKLVAQCKMQNPKFTYKLFYDEVQSIIQYDFRTAVANPFELYESDPSCKQLICLTATANSIKGDCLEWDYIYNVDVKNVGIFVNKCTHLIDFNQTTGNIVKDIVQLRKKNPNKKLYFTKNNKKQMEEIKSELEKIYPPEDIVMFTADTEIEINKHYLKKVDGKLVNALPPIILGTCTMNVGVELRADTEVITTYYAIDSTTIADVIQSTSRCRTSGELRLFCNAEKLKGYATMDQWYEGLEELANAVIKSNLIVGGIRKQANLELLDAIDGNVDNGFVANKWKILGTAAKQNAKQIMVTPSFVEKELRNHPNFRGCEYNIENSPVFEEDKELGETLEESENARKEQDKIKKEEKANNSLELKEAVGKMTEEQFEAFITKPPTTEPVIPGGENGLILKFEEEFIDSNYQDVKEYNEMWFSEEFKPERKEYYKYSEPGKVPNASKKDIVILLLDSKTRKKFTRDVQIISAVKHWSENNNRTPSALEKMAFYKSETKVQKNVRILLNSLKKITGTDKFRDVTLSKDLTKKLVDEYIVRCKKESVKPPTLNKLLQDIFNFRNGNKNTISSLKVVYSLQQQL